MENFEKLYDEYEKAKVRFIGFTTNDVRYDYGIVYTTMFFGKTLVVCIQTGRSALLGPQDMFNTQYIREIFKINSDEEATAWAEQLSDLIPSETFTEQYE